MVMKMYHEIYGKYYKLITKLLNSGPLTKNQINNYITKYGFISPYIFISSNPIAKHPTIL